MRSHVILSHFSFFLTIFRERFFFTSLSYYRSLSTFNACNLQLAFEKVVLSLLGEFFRRFSPSVCNSMRNFFLSRLRKNDRERQRVRMSRELKYFGQSIKTNIKQIYKQVNWAKTFHTCCMIFFYKIKNTVIVFRLCGNKTFIKPNFHGNSIHDWTNFESTSFWTV